MRGLLTDANEMVIMHGDVEKGIFPEADKENELYKVTSGDGVVRYAATSFIYKATEEPLPEDFSYGKYCYGENGFYLNPDWREPEPAPGEKIAALEEQVNLLTSALMEMSADVYGE